ncbi:hypothetical protein EC957_007465 [Mortierella hygrophila]|uniref:Uncharacterized protein n=1 Tax=Mortierella hygrophila TaxID=979708 RepID=A0A9P6FDT7_9FUNG|nr:hypothetical protein EC957_007465 [Mortierella hygrophila]
MFINSWSQLAWWKTHFTPNRYSHDQIPDLTGKVAIVTGANTGLGYATTALAAHGAQIKAKYPNSPKYPQLEFLELNLNDMNKTYQAVKEFLGKDLPLHILVDNSGIMDTPFGLSADGIET